MNRCPTVLALALLTPSFGCKGPIGDGTAVGNPGMNDSGVDSGAPAGGETDGWLALGVTGADADIGLDEATLYVLESYQVSCDGAEVGGAGGDVDLLADPPELLVLRGGEWCTLGVRLEGRRLDLGGETDDGTAWRATLAVDDLLVDTPYTVVDQQLQLTFDLTGLITLADIQAGEPAGDTGDPTIELSGNFDADDYAAVAEGAQLSGELDPSGADAGAYGDSDSAAGCTCASGHVHGPMALWWALLAVLGLGRRTRGSGAARRPVR